MAALASEHLAILKNLLAERFVPFLPRLLDTNRSAQDQLAKQLSRAFNGFALHKLLDIAPSSAASMVVDDILDKGLDAIFYDAPSETLYLVQGKLKASEQFRQDDAFAFGEGVRLLLRRQFSAFNAHVQQRQGEINAALEDCSSIKLIIAYAGDGVSVSAREALTGVLADACRDDERVASEVRYYGPADILSDLLAEQAYQPVTALVKLGQYQKVTTPHLTYYGIVSVADLVSLHNQYGKALYERNIRYFLGASTVNRAIKGTLEDCPEDFYYLNNGVTAVGDMIEPKGQQDGGIRLRVSGLSIINGAQTVAAAAEFVAQNPGKSIGHAKVMFTLINAPAEGQFGKKITKARNNQNPVSAAFFASLDENQERLRQEAALFDYQYLYRPEVTVTGSAQVITRDEAVRALALRQSDPRFPVWVSSEAGRLANPESVEYGLIFPHGLKAATLINSVLCHRAIGTLLNEYELGADARSQERLVYRHARQLVVVAIIKRLHDRIESGVILGHQAWLDLISQPLDSLRQLTFELARTRLTADGPRAYFRNQANVTSFLAALMEQHYALAADPALARLRNVQAVEEDFPRQRLMDYLAHHAPQL